MEIAKSTPEVISVEKTKVTEAEVIVERVEIGYYFCIKYKEVGQDYFNIGFGSSNVHLVFNWLDEYLEIV
jgi:hypothetical protein